MGRRGMHGRSDRQRLSRPGGRNRPSRPGRRLRPVRRDRRDDAFASRSFGSRWRRTDSTGSISAGPTRGSSACANSASPSSPGCCITGPGRSTPVCSIRTSRPSSANYAARVAERYPWIDHWTPVNEPLTTARFSGLYGHWYPHRRDYPAFLRALANQCRGTLEAMRDIRAVIPRRELVQTEDLGKTFSTQPLRYQAAHENERRWLSLDLLTGRVTSKHNWHKILFGAGIGWAELEAFEGGEAAPDILGINHYLTSERFLDHRTPPLSGSSSRRESPRHLCRCRGGAGEEAGGRYRLRAAPARGVGALPHSDRDHRSPSRLPSRRAIALVRRGLGDRPALRGEGVDLRAVTIWSMFGNVDWRFLLTERRGLYDTGAYDVRSGTPRPTVIAKAASALARGGASITRRWTCRAGGGGRRASIPGAGAASRWMATAANC